VAREKKQRIATTAGPTLRTNPFASLEFAGRELAEKGRDTRLACPPPSKRTSEALVPTPAEKLLLRRSTAHRGGKTVLVLEGFSPAWTGTKLEALLHELKTSLGCGGKIEARTLELQGELADRLIPLLEARGFSIKRGW
jgi:translation initiation factor 1 (eIF-1/SUI1)